LGWVGDILRLQGGHTKGRGVKILEPEDKVVEEHPLKLEVSLA